MKTQGSKGPARNTTISASPDESIELSKFQRPPTIDDATLQQYNVEKKVSWLGRILRLLPAFGFTFVSLFILLTFHPYIPYLADLGAASVSFFDTLISGLLLAGVVLIAFPLGMTLSHYMVREPLDSLPLKVWKGFFAQESKDGLPKNSNFQPAPASVNQRQGSLVAPQASSGPAVESEPSLLRKILDYSASWFSVVVSVITLFTFADKIPGLSGLDANSTTGEYAIAGVLIGGVVIGAFIIGKVVWEGGKIVSAKVAENLHLITPEEHLPGHEITLGVAAQLQEQYQEIRRLRAEIGQLHHSKAEQKESKTRAPSPMPLPNGALLQQSQEENKQLRMQIANLQTIVATQARTIERQTTTISKAQSSEVNESIASYRIMPRLERLATTLALRATKGEDSVSLSGSHDNLGDLPRPAAPTHIASNTQSKSVPSSPQKHSNPYNPHRLTGSPKKHVTSKLPQPPLVSDSSLVSSSSASCPS